MDLVSHFGPNALDWQLSAR